MKISTKGRYALRLMLDLALHDQEKPIRLKDVAARQEISVKYLESIAGVLAKAGYIRSLRGAQGGYFLKYSAEQYKVGDILRLTEGSMAPVDCLETELERTRHRSQKRNRSLHTRRSRNMGKTKRKRIHYLTEKNEANDDGNKSK